MVSFPVGVIFTCPRCRRTRDFGSTYIPPLGRSYICPCGLSTVVRPSWAADGTKLLVSSGPKDPAPATPKQQKQVAVPIDAVKERLGREEPERAAAAEAAATGVTRAPSTQTGVTPAPADEDEATELSVEDVSGTGPGAAFFEAVTSRGPAVAALAPPAATPSPAPPPPPRVASPTPPARVVSPTPPPARVVSTTPPPAPAPVAVAPSPAATSPAAAPRPAAPTPPVAAANVPPRVQRRVPLGFVDATGSAPSAPATAQPPSAAVGAFPAPPPARAPAPTPVPVARAAAAAQIAADADDEVAEIGDSAPPAPIAPPSTEAGAIPIDAHADEPSDWQLELTKPGPSSLFPAKPPIETSVPPRALAPMSFRVPSAVPEAPPQAETTVPEAHVPAEPVPAVPVPPETIPESAAPGSLADALEPRERPAAPKRRWWVRGLIVLAKVTAPLALFGAGVLYVEYLQLERDLPSLATIKNYRPPIVTEIHDANGELVGRYAEEERYVLPLDEIPLMVRHAFLAAEDADFYSHKGIDYKSILRALVKNAESGGKRQGGSTITQQVARAFLLSREKTYRRKVQEILLSRKMEEELTKDEILHRYLNQIFFGKGAYGVEAAARVHFGKHTKDLTIAEAALLAGLPQAPSSYSPETHPDEALRRRHYVLGQMRDNGWITKDEYASSDKEPLKLAAVPDPTLIAAPWSVEEIRRELVEKFGRDVVYRDGLQVTATIDAKLEAAAQQSVRDGLAMLDRRMGYRGAPAHVTADKIDATAAALGAEAPKAGDRVKGVVDEVSPEHVWVRLAGGAKGVLHALDNPWAYPPNPDQYWKYRTASDLGKVLKVGDVVDVRVTDEKDSAWTADQAAKAKKKGFHADAKLAAKIAGRLPLVLLQQPEIEASLLSFRIPDGRVLAMAGGTDFEKSQFIRPIQAKRQVGSTFKTIVYTAALSKLPPEILDPDNVKPRAKPKATPVAKLLAALTQSPSGPPIWTLASILLDAPVVMTAKEAELTSKAGGNKDSDEAAEDWKPSNYGNKYYGDTPLRTAFILSRNLPTLQLAQKVGVKEIMAMARKLGVESDLPPDLSIALGTASLSLLEISRVHAVIANGGIAVQPRFLARVVDRDGKTLYDLEIETAKNPPQQVLDPKPAFVMTQLLNDVAKFGTASKAADLKRPSGGKTGTTNDYIDAWYIGFTPSIVTGVWVGYDQVRSLGVGETGGEAALPIWVQYMKAATTGHPKEDFTPPDGVVKLKIDRKSGKLAWPGESGEDIVETWFVKGTEPIETARPGKINETPNIFQADPGLR